MRRSWEWQWQLKEQFLRHGALFLWHYIIGLDTNWENPVYSFIRKGGNSRSGIRFKLPFCLNARKHLCCASCLQRHWSYMWKSTAHVPVALEVTCTAQRKNFRKPSLKLRLCPLRHIVRAEIESIIIADANTSPSLGHPCTPSWLISLHNNSCFIKKHNLFTIKMWCVVVRLDNIWNIYF